MLDSEHKPLHPGDAVMMIITRYKNETWRGPFVWTIEGFIDPDDFPKNIKPCMCGERLWMYNNNVPQICCGCCVKKLDGTDPETNDTFTDDDLRRDLCIGELVYTKGTKHPKEFYTDEDQ